MEEVLDIVVLGRNARNASNIKNRQPIKAMYVKGDELEDIYTDIIKDELNIKEVKFIDSVDEYTTYKFKPKFATLKQKCGKELGVISKELQVIDGSKAMQELRTKGFIKVPGVDVELTEEDLLIETFKTEGYEVVSDYNLVIVLDKELTKELLEEGMVREIVSKVQTMRKDAGFEVVDHIKLYVTGNDKVSEIVSRNMEVIKSDVLCDEICFTSEDGFSKEWNLNGETVTLAVKKM